MIEIRTNFGEVNVKGTGTNIILLAEAASIVNALYDTFNERIGKRVADAFADLTMQNLANLKEGRSTPFEDESESSKPEEKCEPGEIDLSATKRKLDAASGAIEALEKLRAVIEESKKED